MFVLLAKEENSVNLWPREMTIGNVLMCGACLVKLGNFELL